MNYAIQLAEQRIGLTGENPSVGCVIVKNKKIISTGQTGIGGTPHAESIAIDNAVEKVAGGILYSTLEPCSHIGKTPSCVHKIIKSKIKKVFFAINDVDNRSANKSIKYFKKKKISVVTGFLENKARKLYRSYFHLKKTKLPFVVGKIAISKNLYFKFNNKYISNFHSLSVSHLLRYQSHAIMVSYKTINNDNPKLNCRLKGLEKFSPIRIILDKDLKINKKSNILKNSNNLKTIIFFNKTNKNTKYLKKCGVSLIKTPLDKNKNLDLENILKKIKKLKIHYLLVESGNILIEQFLNKKLFNEFYLFNSNKTVKNTSKKNTFKFKKRLNSYFKNKVNLSTYLEKDYIVKYY